MASVSGLRGALSGFSFARPATWGFLAGAFALALYAPTVNYDLVWDDPLILEFVRSHVADHGLSRLFTSEFRLHANDSTGYFRPLVHLSFWIDSALSGDLPWFFHLTNTVLHTANTLLVFRVSRLLFPRLGVAVVAACLFAVHPVHIESVAFVSGRTDLWATCFGLLAVVAWLKSRRAPSATPWPGIVLGCLFFGLGVLSKESVVVLPLVLICWEFLVPTPADGDVRLRTRTALFWFLGWFTTAIGVLWMRLGVAGIGFGAAGMPAGHPSLIMADFPASVGVWAASFKVLWFPWPLIPLYQAERLALSPAAVVSVAATLALGAFLAPRSRDRAGLLGLSWLILFLVPVSGVIPLSGPLFAQRFLYLPSVGFCLGAGYALGMALRREQLRAFTIAATAGGMALLAFSTVTGSELWRDELSLSRQLIRFSPRYLGGHLMRGSALRANGRPVEALSAYQAALKTWPESPMLHYNLGNVLLDLGRTGEAERAFRRAVDLKPDFALAWNNLGAALIQAGRPEEAIPFLRQALQTDPGCQAARSNLSRLLQSGDGPPGR